VTGTGTNIGKTYVTAGIIRAARAAGQTVAAIKPLVSGFDAAAPAGSDPAVLLEAMGKPVTPGNIAAISPWRFAAPLSPDMAAAKEGRKIDINAVIAFCEAAMEGAPEGLLIEGPGGVAVPLDEKHLVAEWIAGLRIPAIIVAGTYLGTISHTITAAEALSACGVQIAAIVLSESLEQPVPAAQTAATIARFVPDPIYVVGRTNNAGVFGRLAGRL